MKTLAYIWNVWLERYWNWIPAGIQGLTYSKEERQKAKKYLEQIKCFMPEINQIVCLLGEDGFHWSSDPMGGVLDFHQHPWVTVARRTGDCDDFAELWYAIVKDFGKAERVVTASRGWSFHKMCILTMDEKCYLLSNTGVAKVVPEINKKQLETEFYGDNTWFTIVY